MEVKKKDDAGLSQTVREFGGGYTFFLKPCSISNADFLKAIDLIKSLVSRLVLSTLFLRLRKCFFVFLLHSNLFSA